MFTPFTVSRSENTVSGLASQVARQKTTPCFTADCRLRTDDFFMGIRVHLKASEWLFRNYPEIRHSPLSCHQPLFGSLQIR